MSEQAGRELDAMVHEQVMGLSLKPSREYAMAKVVWKYTYIAGNPLVMSRNGTRREFALPPGETLRQPEGSDYWNDRYALAVAELLGDEIAEEVDAYRLDPPPYSTDLAAAWLVWDKLAEERSWMLQKLEGRYIIWYVYDDDWHRTAEAETAPLVICHAALTEAGEGGAT